MVPRLRRVHSFVAASLLAGFTLMAASSAQAYLGWMQRTPPTVPPPRTSPLMVYDQARDRVVLFGGWSNVSASCCVLGDTWEWDGAQWLLRQPATVPPPRAGAAAAYDTQRQRVVMFGGSDFANYLADTWEWDGNDWLLRSPPVAPPARMLGGAAYDTVRHETVLFGGFDGATYWGDTWVWNGTTWTQRTTATHPGPRKQMAMVHDEATGATLLFGGEQGAGTPYGDTWLWNGSAWSLQAPGTAPGARWATGAAFDPLHGRVVLFAGFTTTGLTNEMWEWDGLTWNQRGAVQSPLPRQNAGFVFSTTGEALLFGGLAVVAGGAFGDTWTFRAGYAAHFGTFGSGCAGTAGTPQLGKHPGYAQLPWIGSTFGFRITNVPAGGLPPLVLFGWSNSTFLGAGLPLSLAALGMPNCSLLCSTEVPLASGLTGTTADLLLAIPATTSILGSGFYCQAFVFDPAANPFGATLSNAGDVVVGNR